MSREFASDTFVFSVNRSKYSSFSFPFRSRPKPFHLFNFEKGKVCKRAKWLNTPELIPVSVA